jgi:hypothetical protein
MADDRPNFGGAFNPQPVPRVKKLSVAQSYSQGFNSFYVQPGGSNFKVFEGSTSQIAPSQGSEWMQQVAKPSKKMSTKYSALAKASNVTDVTRANKALVRGNSDTLSPERGVNVWREKQFSNEGAMTASLFRINEPSTALGPESMGDPSYDAGMGIMAELLSQKWQAKSADKPIGRMDNVLPTLTDKYPQLDSVARMRTETTEEGLSGQISQSRMDAAKAAAARGIQKGVGPSQLNEYVQRKFNKHGLGPVPKGWNE